MPECEMAEWRERLDAWNATQRRRNHGEAVWVWTNEDEAEGDWWYHCKDCGAMTKDTKPLSARPLSKKEREEIDELFKQPRRIE